MNLNKSSFSCWGSAHIVDGAGPEPPGAGGHRYDQRGRQVRTQNVIIWDGSSKHVVHLYTEIYNLISYSMDQSGV